MEKEGFSGVNFLPSCERDVRVLLLEDKRDVSRSEKKKTYERRGYEPNVSRWRVDRRSSPMSHEAYVVQCWVDLSV